MNLNQYQVFPTHVGVNRDRAAGRPVVYRIPHACGGEPFNTPIAERADVYSPRMWG